MRYSYKKNSKGYFLRSFTLVELLVSVSIFAMVAVAVSSTFSQGLKVWKRGNVDKRLEQTIRLTLEKMAGELRNAFIFLKIKFIGEENSLKFASLVNSTKAGTTALEVGRLAYFFDKGTNIFYRQQKTYPEVYQEEIGFGEPDSFDKENSKKLISGGIEEINFTYCYLDDTTGAYEWANSWGKKIGQESIPKAVKIELVYKDGSGVESEISKTIFIPLGTGKEKKDLPAATAK